VIRTASAEDAGVMAQLCGELGYPATGEQVRGRMRREDAHRFYEERGYRCSKRQAVFGKTLSKAHEG
jgi:hypothetical protein